MLLAGSDAARHEGCRARYQGLPHADHGTMTWRNVVAVPGVRNPDA